MYWYNEYMEKIDLRTLTEEERTLIRKQVIRLHNKGMKNVEIAEVLNIVKNAVSRIVSSYDKEGIKSIKEEKRGRRYGAKRALSPEQEKEIQKLIIDKTPEQMKMSFVLWTRAAIQQLIKDRYGITIPKVYLELLGTLGNDVPETNKACI